MSPTPFSLRLHLLHSKHTCDQIPLRRSEMKGYVGLLPALLCVFVMLSCAVGSPEKNKIIQQTTITAAATPIKHGSRIEKAAKLWKRYLVCPDEKSECPYGNTCCKFKSDSYGCCPLENAVCCSDREHCCPYGYTCRINGECTK